MALQPVPIAKPRTTYELGVTPGRVADLSTEEALAAVGLSIDLIRSDGVGECRQVGAACAWHGFDG